MTDTDRTGGRHKVIAITGASSGIRRVRVVDAAVTEFSQLDVLVNNAGIGPISPLDDLRVDEWDEMIDVNLGGVLHGIAAALAVFRGPTHRTATMLGRCVGQPAQR
ncbi:SDR family oxidoreductase [Nonomuraea sp. CA-141351]|uniref:SDR family oxidoreductase n=1 Tax=Nonomuraea sp. CA-141351 TaxID=3239996 RepID=UPI003D8FCF52